MPKIHEHAHDGKRYWYFQCPGCQTVHGIASHMYGGGPGWSFNGDLDRPTFSPSILVYPSHKQGRCHSFVRDGKIEFLGDCDHALKGQTVELPELVDFNLNT